MYVAEYLKTGTAGWKGKYIESTLSLKKLISYVAN